MKSYTLKRELKGKVGQPQPQKHDQLSDLSLSCASLSRQSSISDQTPLAQQTPKHRKQKTKRTNCKNLIAQVKRLEKQIGNDTESIVRAAQEIRQDKYIRNIKQSLATLNQDKILTESGQIVEKEHYFSTLNQVDFSSIHLVNKQPMTKVNLTRNLKLNNQGKSSPLHNQIQTRKINTETTQNQTQNNDTVKLLLPREAESEPKEDDLIKTNSFDWLKKKPRIQCSSPITNGGCLFHIQTPTDAVPKRKTLLKEHDSFSSRFSTVSKDNKKQVQIKLPRQSSFTKKSVKRSKTTARDNMDTNSQSMNSLSKKKRPISSGSRRLEIKYSNSALSSQSVGMQRINQYVMTKSLGLGASAKVVEVIEPNMKDDDNAEDKHYAMKIINRDKLVGQDKQSLCKTSSQNVAFQYIAEFETLRELDHPNIVRLHEVIDDSKEDNIYLVFDLLQNGSMQDELDKTNEYLDPEKLWTWARQIVSALCYCHKKNVCHRDIKPENIMIDDQKNLKLIDFGISAIIEDGNDLVKNTIGSVRFFAPEQVRTGVKNKVISGRQLDVWAFGVTLYYMATKEYPFIANTMFGIQNKLLNTEPTYENITDPLLVNLLKKIFIKDLNLRPTFDQIAHDPWITREGSQDLTEQSYYTETEKEETEESTNMRQLALGEISEHESMSVSHSQLSQDVYTPKTGNDQIQNEQESNQGDVISDDFFDIKFSSQQSNSQNLLPELDIKSNPLFNSRIVPDLQGVPEEISEYSQANSCSSSFSAGSDLSKH